MATRITAYRRTMQRAQYAGELGVTLQLEPWGGNDSRYEAIDEPITIELVDGWEYLVSAGEEPPVLYDPADGQVYDLAAAIDLGGARIVG